MKLIPANVFLLIAMLTCGFGCDQDKDVPMSSPLQQAVAPAATQASNALRVVFLGDSLTAGYGLEAEQAFPAVVGQILQKEGLPIRVVNAGVSGDTTAGGLRRLDWLLKQSPDIVVVGLGANDGLRALDLKSIESNLRNIIRKSREAGAEVMLLGMMMPPNYGDQYTRGFSAIYPRLAKEFNIPLVPFMLQGIAGVARYNQSDGVHPTAEGNQIIANTILPELRELVKQRAQKR